MVGKTGFEPATPWSQTKCTTKLCYFPLLLARPVGVEPATFWSVVKRSIQLSYGRLLIFKHLWWLRMESNHRHRDFQSLALPTELQSQNKWRSRRESNSRSSAWQADVITATPRDHLVAEAGFEPTAFGLWARRATRLLHSAISFLAEKEGFEPPRRFRPVGFQDRSLQPDLGISPFWCLRPDLNRHGIWLPQDFKSCASTNFATQAFQNNKHQFHLTF